MVKVQTTINICEEVKSEAKKQGHSLTFLVNKGAKLLLGMDIDFKPMNDLRDKILKMSKLLQSYTDKCSELEKENKVLRGQPK